MGFVPNPYGFPGVVTGSVALLLAALVYFTRPHREQNRWLAIALALEGVLALTGTGFMFLTDSFASAYAWQAVTILALLALVPVHLIFVSTLDSPLQRILRPRAVRIGLIALALLSPLVWLTGRDEFIVTLVPVPFAPWEIVPGPRWFASIVVLGLVYVVGLVAAVFALVRARTPIAKAQARAYVVAFAVHDILWAIIGFVPTFVPALAPNTPIGVYIFGLGPPLMHALFFPLLAYGILKAQLFDIDLRIKWGIQRGTVVAAFAAVFFVVGTVAENFLSDTYGYLIGGAAAGLLLFALAPLQRVAERVADNAMPRVSGSAEYLAYKKFEVYRAAVEGALEDGGITQRERSMLARLRRQLEIRDEDATQMERELAEARGM